MYSIPFLDIPPLAGIGGTVRVPGSKSISNRALLLAGFAEGTTAIDGLLRADDTDVMVEALAALGCRIESGLGGQVVVTGLGSGGRVAQATLRLGNAGTAMRPLAAALAISARPGERFELRGSPRMHERPIADLVGALRSVGATIDYLGEDGFPPLAIRAPNAALDFGRPIIVKGDVSSQFLTSLLLALPLAHTPVPAPLEPAPSLLEPAPSLLKPAPSLLKPAPSLLKPAPSLLEAMPARAEPLRQPPPSGASGATIEVSGELISKPYVAITLALLERFGVTVERDGWQRFRIPADARLRSPGRFVVEGDATSASYFIGAAAIAARDAPLRIEGVGSRSIQGDLAFVEAVRAMGAEVVVGPTWLDVRRGRFPLAPLAIDANAIPDAAMTLATLALFADGASRIDNIASWRVKETDRLAAMASELRKLGARVDEGESSLEIEPPTQWRASAIETFDDHRMAMALSLAAFNGAAGTAGTAGSADTTGTAGSADTAGTAGTSGATRVTGTTDATGAPASIRILGPRCVGKTWPDYFEQLFAVASAKRADIPVLAIDGPTASGKGTLAAAVARSLGYVLLDSGAVYRATAVAAIETGVAADDEAGLEALALALDLRFAAGRTLLGTRDITDLLRLETVGALASKISAWPRVRGALLDVQLAFRHLPGLVADGRDMGTVVFPDAALKVFLTAGAAERAERRHKQLIEKGLSVNIDGLRADLEARDARDKNRSASPLVPAEGALLLDNSALSIETSVELVLKAWKERRPFRRSP